MSEVHRLHTPLTAAALAPLRSGDRVLLTGTIYTARDAAHKRLHALLTAGDALPFDLTGAAIYYAGPTPTPPGRVIGSIGPTTSYRMDPFAPALYDAGLKATIGKGERGPEVIDAIVRNGGVYLVAIGGAAVVLAQAVKAARTIAYEDLGAEAIRELTVEDFPCIVAVDALGTNIYRR
jgi:fumarate hydratase subunit beta